MSPIEQLMGEHRLIEQALDALEGWVRGMLADGHDGRAELAEHLRFITRFADAWHHGKEEDIFFATMVEHGFPREQGPIAVMLHEHELGRGYLRTLGTLAASAAPWTEAERRGVERAALSYTGLLEPHIHKEDQILYPMGAAHIPDEAMDAMQARFARFVPPGADASEYEELKRLGASLAARYGARRG